jgi:hypothetical protein
MQEQSFQSLIGEKPASRNYSRVTIWLRSTYFPYVSQRYIPSPVAMGMQGILMKNSLIKIKRFLICK